MFLDNIQNDTDECLQQNIRRFFDHTALGECVIPLDRMAESQTAIALELSSLLLEARTPQVAWVIILRVLRLLPWAIDPELARQPCLYRFFGGLEHTSEEHLFDKLAESLNNQETWSSIVSIAEEHFVGNDKNQKI